MPPKSKATTRSDKKGKAVKKSVTAMVNSEHELDLTSGEEGPSMKNMFQSLTAMMALLNTRMDQMDGGGRKKRKVAFRGSTPVPICPHHPEPPQRQPLSLRQHCCNPTAMGLYLQVQSQGRGKKEGRRGFKSPASPPILTTDKCDKDIQPPAASLSLTLHPPEPPAGTIRPALVAITASRALMGAGPCAPAPFHPPQPSPHGFTVL